MRSASDSHFTIRYVLRNNTHQFKSLPTQAMKLAAVLLALTTGLVAAQTSMVPPQHQERFLKSQNELVQELLAWKNSSAGAYAKQHGLVPSTIDTESTTGYSTEELERFFLAKLKIAKVQIENPHATFSTNTPFALLTSDEFAKFVNKGFRPDAGFEATEVEVLPEATATSVDWTTDSKCVPAVKDQGQCGDCWAFSTVGAIESGNCLKTGTLTLLSEQQLTSCDTSNSGCDGGLMKPAFTYVKTNGICTSAGYPFTSGTSGSTGTCQSTCTKSVKISGYASVTASDAGFASAIAVQPVSVAIAASSNAFSYYTGGVLTSCGTSLDHAVIAVGYGVDASSKVPYFKIRNSWGSSWGEAGYIRLKRGSSVSTCGIINSYAAYPKF